MKKPEKKKIDKKAWRDITHWESIGYNRACEDWEKWLPSNKEILQIIYMYMAGLGALGMIAKPKLLAKAISARIRGDK